MCTFGQNPKTAFSLFFNKLKKKVTARKPKPQEDGKLWLKNSNNSLDDHKSLYAIMINGFLSFTYMVARKSKISKGECFQFHRNIYAMVMHEDRSKKKKADIYNEVGKPKKKININKHIIIAFRNPYILAITKQPSIISDEYYSCNANAQNQKKNTYIHQKYSWYISRMQTLNALIPMLKK